MTKDLTDKDARIICGAIRRRKCLVALFKTHTGFKLRALHKTTDNQFGFNNFVGAYNRRTSYQKIKTDWNETI